MENTEDKNLPQEESRGYVPRPAWQVWAARIGLVLFVALVIWETLRLANGWL